MKQVCVSAGWATPDLETIDRLPELPRGLTDLQLRPLQEQASLNHQYDRAGGCGDVQRPECSQREQQLTAASTLEQSVVTGCHCSVNAAACVHHVHTTSGQDLHCHSSVRQGVGCGSVAVFPCHHCR